MYFTIFSIHIFFPFFSSPLAGVTQPQTPPLNWNLPYYYFYAQQPNGGVLVNWEKDWGWIPDIDLALESQNKIISICETDLSKKGPKGPTGAESLSAPPGIAIFSHALDR